MMQRIAELRSRRGTTTRVGYDFSGGLNSFERLVDHGEVDCFIVSTEDGYSPLGTARDFFVQELGMPHVISALANWNRFENDQVSIVVLPSRRSGSKLRGVLLAAGESSKCYEKRFRPVAGGMPYRDFYYNVAYEGIACAANVLGARRIAMSHLSRSGIFHEDIAICTAEALGHFCDGENNAPVESFMFVGCCIDAQRHLSGIHRLNREGHLTRHRPIQTRLTYKDGYPVLNLDWPIRPS
jgi:hypothetical protein